MADHTNRILKHLQAAPPADGADPTDGELLAGFVERRDGDAFAALVARHGPMVWGVCRRLLGPHDAEDAFQATFLVLVRKAAAVAPREKVGGWLHGVARQTALQARRNVARRRAREAGPSDAPDPRAAPPDPWHELLPLLDEEIARLPERYRAVVVLCDLGGATRRDAARRLGVPEGTVAGRLARARELLARRLGRRGGLLSGALAALLAQRAAPAGVPASVVSSTLRAVTQVAAGRAAGLVAPHAAGLTEGVIRAMLLTKLKNAVLAVAVTAAATTAAGGVILQAPADPPADPPAGPAPGVPVTPPNVVPAVASKSNVPAPPPSVVPELPPNAITPLPAFEIPVPPTVDQLRSRYVKLHEELASHMTDPLLKQRIAELEQEVAAAKVRREAAAREKKASDELAAARATLAKIAATYGGTDAGAKAKQALDLTDLPPGTIQVLPTPTGGPALPPLPPGMAELPAPPPPDLGSSRPKQ